MAPKSRSVASLSAAACNSELRLRTIVVSWSRVCAPPSADSRNAFDSWPNASLIFWPLPSAIAAPEFTTSATGPLPLPSPFSDTEILSNTPSTRANSTGVLVRGNPMVSRSRSTGPPRYGGVSSICRSVRIDVEIVTACASAGTFTPRSTVNCTST